MSAGRLLKKAEVAGSGIVATSQPDGYAQHIDEELVKAYRNTSQRVKMLYIWGALQGHIE
jgi:hypothetical protein